MLFLLGIPTHLSPLPLRLLGGVGGLLVAGGLGCHLWVLWPSVTRIWRIPLIFLGLKTAATVIMALPPTAIWAERAGLRVSYLHWLLLGFITLGLVAAAKERWSIRGDRWLAASVVILTLTLLPLTQLWPVALAGRWTLHAAAWGALGPVLAALALILFTVRKSA